MERIKRYKAITQNPPIDIALFASLWKMIVIPKRSHSILLMTTDSHMKLHTEILFSCNIQDRCFSSSHWKQQKVISQPVFHASYMYVSSCAKY